MSITTALEARRDALREREAGFTLIELLVVVIIIGILAAIAIPVYLGVQNNSKDAGVKSDLTNAKVAIVSTATDANGSLPASITAARSSAGAVTATATMPTGSSPATVNLIDKGWSQSSNTNSFAYVAGSNGAWCLVAAGSTGNSFVINSSSAVAAYSGSAACTPA